MDTLGNLYPQAPLTNQDIPRIFYELDFFAGLLIHTSSSTGSFDFITEHRYSEFPGGFEL